MARSKRKAAGSLSPARVRRMPKEARTLLLNHFVLKANRMVADSKNNRLTKTQNEEIMKSMQDCGITDANRHTINNHRKRMIKEAATNNVPAEVEMPPLGSSPTAASALTNPSNVTNPATVTEAENSERKKSGRPKGSTKAAKK